MKNLILTSFTVFPTQPPLSTSYICALLKNNDIAVQQIDVNLIIWDYLLSPDFLHRIQFRQEKIKESKCPHVFPVNAFTFKYKKRWAIENIDKAKNVLKDRNLFYRMECFKWAMDVIFQAQKLIYYHYGAFISNKLTYWPHGGFEINSISDIYSLSEDQDSNPFIEIINEVVLPKILQIEPQRIFIDTIFPWDIVQLLTLTKILKKSIPGAHLNFLGCGFDEMSFSRLRNRIESNKKLLFGFDSLFFTRYDKGVIKLANGETDFSSIANLSYVDEGGAPICNTLVKRTEPMQSIIPDYTDLDLSCYFIPNIVFVDKLSEMCYWNRCRYCSINATKSNYVNYDTQFMIQKIRHYRDTYGVNHVWFLDEACKPEHAEHFADAVLQEDQEITWSLRTRISHELDKKLLKKLHSSGLRELWLGLEAISPQLLKDMNKTPIPEEYGDTFKHIVRDCAEIGIGLHACLLLGYPTETQQQRKELLQFFKSIRPYFTSVMVFATFNEFGLMYDSYIYKNQKEFGITHIDEDTNSYNMISIPYRTLNGNDRSNPKHHKQLEKISKSILSTMVNNTSLILPWLNISDSPYELLFKEKFGHHRENPFIKGNGFLNTLSFLASEVLNNTPVICELRDRYIHKKLNFHFKRTKMLSHEVIQE